MSLIVCFDTETALIRPACLAPPLACVTWQCEQDVPHIESARDGLALVRAWLEWGHTLVGHNVAYDLAVLCAADPSLIPLVFRAYEEDRVTDTMLRQKLLDIAAGCYRGRFGTGGKWVKYDYSLEALTRRATGRVLDKDTWRLRYGELIDVPLEEWPEGARTYPKEDARSTWDVYQAQEIHAEYLKDQFRQARAAWWLHLTSAWGLRTTPEGVRQLELATRVELEEIEAQLISAGLVRADGSRDTKKAKARMLEVCGWRETSPGIFEPDANAIDGRPLRLTDTGNVSLDADACEACEDDLLKDYAKAANLKGVLAKDLKALFAGVAYPIHTRFDLAETGRTTSSKPNVQNWRKLPGIRECFVPRPGYVFAQSDYEGLELRTFAQACIDLLGHSELARALNAGLDPHLALAATILGISYDEAKARKAAGDPEIKNARDLAKVANFGFPGGLGAKTFVVYAKQGFGVTITEEDAKALKELWFRTWPEAREYMAYVGRLADGPTGATITQIRSDRVRGGATYTAACNSFFQGLGADATKHAGWLIAKACYVDRSSPLFGCRIVCYVHDEFIVEAPEVGAPEAAEELARLMVIGANEWLPDVPATTEPLLMRAWSKDAKRVVDATGRLVPWEPPPLAA
jgi:hypothetical protein